MRRGALLRFTDALSRFENAAVGYSWMGSGDPEDHEAIVMEYRAARENLIRVVEDICP